MKCFLVGVNQTGAHRHSDCVSDKTFSQQYQYIPGTAGVGCVVLLAKNDDPHTQRADGTGSVTRQRCRILGINPPLTNGVSRNAESHMPKN